MSSPPKSDGEIVKVNPYNMNNKLITEDEVINLLKRFGVDEEQYTTVAVKSSLATVCDEASKRYPRDARLANAAGIEAAVRGDTERARVLLRKAAELAPQNAEYRRAFSRMPMHMMGWHEDVPVSPDPAAAP